jgi:cytochrome P450/NADPH-cytochrome P450 reductase
MSSSKYDEEVIKKKMGLLDLVKKIPELKLTLEVIIQKCQTIMPRYYTIASSSLAHPNEVAIAISLSNFKTFYGGNRSGLTSLYLDKASK